MSFENTIGLIGAILTFIGTLLGYLFQRRERKDTETKTSEKFEELSNLLKTASSRIKEMENELEDKRRRVTDLEEMRKELDELVSLREGQVNAIKRELKSIMEKSARKNRIWTVTIGAIWFVLGLIVRGFLGF